MGKLTDLFTFFTIGRDTLEIPSKNKKKPASTVVETGSSTTGGGRGIRTHETFLPTGFQDQLHRPLGQTSARQFSANWKNSSGELKTSPELNTQALCLIDHASNFCGSYSLST